MSNDGTQAGQGTTASTTTPGTAPAAPPAAPPPAPAQPQAQPPAAPEPPAPPAADPNADPGWLGDRLKRAELAGLKAAGFNSLDEAKAAQAAQAAQADANKTAEQKAADANAEVAKHQAENERLGKTVTDHATRQLATLTDDQRKAVTTIAGDDAARQLDTIDALSPTWAAKLPPAPDPKVAEPTTAAAPAPAVPPAPPPPAPANSVPTGGPPPAPPTGQENHLAVYEDLQSKNPIRAAGYYIAHRESIVSAQQASS